MAQCLRAAPALRLEFRPCFGGHDLLADSLRYENSAGEILSVSRLSWILSGFALERSSGGWVELGNQYAWLDLQKRQLFVQFAGVPEGRYRAIRFYVGPDAAANHADRSSFPPGHPLNPVVNGLDWAWSGGFVFLALEGQYRVADGPLAGYSLHFAQDENRTPVVLSAEFSTETAPALTIDLDVRNLLNAPQPIAFGRDGNSTHSRTGDPVAVAMRANLRTAFRIREIGDPLQPPGSGVDLSGTASPRYLPAKFTPYHFVMGRTFPVPDLPKDNPLTEEGIALGQKLFSEPLLSSNDRMSCLSCHRPGDAFGDPRPVSRGVFGRLGTRNANALFNLAWKPALFWDGRARTLRQQALMPIENPLEMDESIPRVVRKLQQKEEYRDAFTAAFGSPTIDGERIGLALEQFLLSLTSYDSKFDQVVRGSERFTPQEQRGFDLFMTEYDPRTGQYGADCFHCHGGALFTDEQFHNNGLRVTGTDLGRFHVTHLEADRNKFLTPSLRNIAVTAPYMHDGRFATLNEVIDHYDHGLARTPTLDPNLSKHPAEGLHLSAEDKAAIIAFLQTLTDEKFLREHRGIRPVRNDI